MISRERVQEVKRLLARNELSQRAIARMTGISRIVVHRIATGKRKIRLERPREEWDVDRSGKPFERCPACGAKVQLPCIACAIRNVVREGSCERFPDTSRIVMGLDLEEKHRDRYEQVKIWRESQRNPDFTELPEDWPFRSKRISSSRK